MKAVRGCSKEDYVNASPKAIEFATIEAAAEYLASRTGHTVEHMIAAIYDDTACDFIWFDDGSALVIELL